MPKPKKGESKQDYLHRCTGELVKAEGKTPAEAFATCNGYWQEAKGKNSRSVLTLAQPVKITLAGEKEGVQVKPRFSIVAYSGRPVSRWYGGVIMDVAGMRLQEKLPALREHVRTAIVGTITENDKKDGTLYVHGEIHEGTKDGQEVLSLARDGFPWQASIAVWPEKILVLEKGGTHQVNGRTVEGPMEVWTQSRVGEVSFCALGADDDTAAIVLSDHGQEVEVEFETLSPASTEAGRHEEEKMEFTLELLTEKAPELLKQIRDAARNEGTTEERARVVEVLDAGGDIVVTLKAVKDGIPAPQIYKLLYEAGKVARGKTLEELKKEATTPVGQRPEEDPKPAASGAEFDAEVAKLVATGMAKGAAFRKLMKEQPALHQAWIEKKRP